MKNIALNNGTNVIISDKRDIVEAVAEHCSYELAEFLQEIFDEDDWEYECLQDECSNLKSEISDLKAGNECSKEEKYESEIDFSTKITELETEIPRLKEENSMWVMKCTDLESTLRFKEDPDALPF